MPATRLSLDQAALDYAATTVTLSAGQIAGTDPIIAANAARRAIKFRAEADFEIALSAAQPLGQRIYGSARDGLAGNDCPTGAIYLAAGSGATAASQFTAGSSKIVIWEA